MLEGNSLGKTLCQPLLSFYGVQAKLKPQPESEGLKKINLLNYKDFYCYEIRISQFFSETFFDEVFNELVYLVQVRIESDNPLEEAYEDSNVFLEKNFKDVIEYSIILPRSFKSHHRYVIDFQMDNVCTFEEFGKKVDIWKQYNGLI
tara:strand:- start:8004 stop:8444 length:441 start_codon:yes stop_codon:yes gene_type:complete